MITKDSFPNTCHYCEFRHNGFCRHDDIIATYNRGYCKEFIPGKCYYCAINQAMTKEERYKCNFCDEAFYPDGCINFKPGNDYDIFLQYMSSNNDTRPKSDGINLRSKRRRLNCKHRKRLVKIVDYCKYPGPWIKNGRVVPSRRGKISKYLKHRSNKKIRQYKESSLHHGLYKKLYDYWWNIS